MTRKRHARTTACLAAIGLFVTACSDSPCSLSEVPDVGTTGAVDVRHVAGYGYRAMFHGRLWELPMPSASALTELSGRGVVVRGNSRYPRLHVETESTDLDLELALMGCA